MGHKRSHEIPRPVVIDDQEFPAHFVLDPQFRQADFSQVPDGTEVGQAKLEHSFTDGVTQILSVLIWSAGTIIEKTKAVTRRKTNYEKKAAPSFAVAKPVERKPAFSSNGSSKRRSRTIFSQSKRAEGGDDAGSKTTHASKIRTKESKKGDLRGRDSAAVNNFSGGRRY